MTLEKLFETHAESETQMYHELAILYDIIYQHHYNYTTQLQFIKETQPNSCTTILEGACGTGHLTKKLYQTYPQVHGFDASNNMLALAKQKVPPKILHHGTFNTFTPPTPIDYYTILGNSLIHLKNLEPAIKNSTTFLTKNSQIAFDYIQPSELKEQTTEHTFTHNQYKIHRTVHSTKQTPQQYKLKFIFEIQNTNNNTKTTVTDTIQFNAHPKTTIENLLTKYNFSEITHINEYTNGPELEDTITIATK